MKYENPEFERFLTFFDNSPGRLKKYMELLLLKGKATPYATTDRKSLNQVNVVLNTKCNLKCVWCHREEKHFKDSGYLERNGDIEKFKKLIPLLKGFNSIHWGGLAEPLMYKPIFELTKFARDYFPRVRVTTNGTSLMPKINDKIVDAGFTDIEVSLDGFDSETNKKFRGSDEDKIIKYLEDLSSRNSADIQINSVVADVNIDSLWDAIDKLKNVKNLKKIHTIPIFVTQHMIDLGISAAPLEKHMKLLTHWQKKIKEFNLDIKLNPEPGDVSLDPVIAMKRMHNICFTVFEHPFINLDGYITPCGRLQHINLENVLEKGFDGAWNGPKTLRWRQQQLNENYGTYCQRECYMKNNCPGHMNKLDEFMGKYDEKNVILKDLPKQ